MHLTLFCGGVPSKLYLCVRLNWYDSSVFGFMQERWHGPESSWLVWYRRLFKDEWLFPPAHTNGLGTQVELVLPVSHQNAAQVYRVCSVRLRTFQRSILMLKFLNFNPLFSNPLYLLSLKLLTCKCNIIFLFAAKHISFNICIICIGI